MNRYTLRGDEVEIKEQYPQLAEKRFPPTRPSEVDKIVEELDPGETYVETSDIDNTTPLIDEVIQEVSSEKIPVVPIIEVSAEKEVPLQTNGISESTYSFIGVGVVLVMVLILVGGKLINDKLLT